jgi:hypothetical protein
MKKEKRIVKRNNLSNGGNQFGVPWESTMVQT